MRSTLPCFVLLFVFISILSRAVNGGNISSVSNKTPNQVYYKPVICNMVKDSHSSEAIKSLEATLVARLVTLENKFEQLLAAVNKSFPGSPIGRSFASCKNIYENRRSQGNKAYLLQMGSTKVPVYCHMTSSGLGACGGGGWTLAMKIDGSKPTFRYDSALWSNQVTFNLPAGTTGLDKQESKLPTYWNTHFSKICLGMKIGHQTKFIVVNKHANSLYSLIADGKYRATSLGRNTWKTLIGSQASLQPNCNMEGFNAHTSNRLYSMARIGILGNNQNDCDSNNSRIGFGGAGSPDDSNTCGEEAVGSPYNGVRHIKAMGYILIQ